MAGILKHATRSGGDGLLLASLEGNNAKCGKQTLFKDVFRPAGHRLLKRKKVDETEGVSTWQLHPRASSPPPKESRRDSAAPTAIARQGALATPPTRQQRTRKGSKMG